MKKITVERLIQGALIREGAGVKLHRYIGAERSDNFEPLLLLDYFNSSEPLDFIAGFPPHPHRGFETITYLLQGSITHEDNKGHKGTIGPGDVQWMTAGKGIVHSEMPSSATGHLQGLQLWLNLPAKDKMRTPRYQEVVNELLPIETKDGVRIKVIAGTTDAGTTSPITDIATNPLFLDITFEPGMTFTQHLHPESQAVLMVISGSIMIGTQSIDAGYLAQLASGEVLELKAIDACQCLLIAAVKLHEPIARLGPFVMNSQEELMQAVDDFRNNRF